MFFRRVALLGNGFLRQGLVKHMNRNYQHGDHWQRRTTIYTPELEPVTDMGVVFFDVPCQSEDYVRMLAQMKVRYLRVFPANILRHSHHNPLTKIQNVFLPNVATTTDKEIDWEKFLNAYVEDKDEIYVI